MTVEREPKDAAWYEDMKKNTAFEGYNYLSGTKKQRGDEKNRLMDTRDGGVIEDNPELGLDMDMADRRKLDQTLVDLYRRIQTGDSLSEEEAGMLGEIGSDDEANDSLVRKILLGNVASKIFENRMLIAATEAQSDGEEKYRAMDRWRKLNEVVYGKIDAKVLAFAIHHALDLAGEYLESEDETARQAAQRLEELLPDFVYSRNYPSSALRGLRNVLLTEEAYDVDGNRNEEFSAGILGDAVLEMVSGIRYKAEGDDEASSITECWEMVERIRTTCEQMVEGDEKETAMKVLDALPKKIDVRGVSYEPPEEELLDYVREFVEEQFGDILEKIDEDSELVNGILIKKETFTPEEAVPYFQMALDTFNATEWKVIIDRERGIKNLSVDQLHEEILIPEDFEFTATRLKALMVHEVGKHVVSRVKGVRAEMKQVGLGLYTDYETGEEGFAGSMELAAMNEKFGWEYLDRHMALGLAAGLDGDRRDFKETFELMYNFYYLRNLKRGDTQERADSEAVRLAYIRGERTFRGTIRPLGEGTNDEKQPMPFLKDKAYAEGFIHMWDMLARDKNLIRMALLGKYDPANPKHVETLRELGTWQRVAQEMNVDGDALYGSLKEYWNEQV